MPITPKVRIGDLYTLSVSTSDWEAIRRSGPGIVRRLTVHIGSVRADCQVIGAANKPNIKLMITGVRYVQ